MSHLNLDQAQIDRARDSARRIARQVFDDMSGFTTTTVERATLRLMGVDGVDEVGIPLPNRVVSHLQAQNLLQHGAATVLVGAMGQHGLTAQQVAESVATGSLTLARPADEAAARVCAQAHARTMCAHIAAQRARRTEKIASSGEAQTPWLYLIVATGNIHEDVVQARAAAEQGADIIAVIRSTGQSLLDYVPYGATTEGFGGTYATQENFRLMRAALDEVGSRLGRYIRLTNYCSGLCMPEIAAMGAIERLDMMLNDSMYGIIFRDINMKRTFIDQFFSRMVNAYAGIIINTGEDNYLTTADAFDAAHTVLASQLINEQFAELSGLRPEQMGLGHAFEIHPELENGFLWELAHAQLVRQVFPEACLKYMPPTKHMTGNIFKGHVQDALFNAFRALGRFRGGASFRTWLLTIGTNLLKDRRGEHRAVEYLSGERMIVRFEVPLSEIVLDFYDKLKSVSKGYASFDYHTSGHRASNLVKLEILIHGEPVDALSQIVHKEKSYYMGKALCEKLKELIPRQMFEVAIQAVVHGKAIARETIPAARKDVLAKCYGGDITRKRKLLEKQKEGKKRAKLLGSVEIPQEAFLAVLKISK